MQGWLFDVKNAQSPQVLGKQYREEANDDNARMIAHRFADEIIFRPRWRHSRHRGDARYYFVSNRSGHKEIWEMDYDGANQKQITQQASISLSPHVSPDGSRIAFSGVTKEVGRFRCVPWNSTAWSTSRASAEPTSRRRGRQTDRSWRFRPRDTGDTEIYSSTAAAGSAPPDQRQGSRRFTDLESAKPMRRSRGSADAPACRRSTPWHPTEPTSLRVTDRDTRSRLVVAQRTVSGLRLDPPLWPRCARRQRHLRHGHRQQAVGAVDARRRPQRFSVVVAGRPTYRLPIESHW